MRIGPFRLRLRVTPPANGQAPTPPDTTRLPPTPEPRPGPRWRWSSATAAGRKTAGRSIGRLLHAHRPRAGLQDSPHRRRHLTVSLRYRFHPHRPVGRGPVRARRCGERRANEGGPVAADARVVGRPVPHRVPVPGSPSSWEKPVRIGLPVRPPPASVSTAARIARLHPANRESRPLPPRCPCQHAWTSTPPQFDRRRRSNWAQFPTPTGCPVRASLGRCVPCPGTETASGQMSNPILCSVSGSGPKLPAPDSTRYCSPLSPVSWAIRLRPVRPMTGPLSRYSGRWPNLHSPHDRGISAKHRKGACPDACVQPGEAGTPRGVAARTDTNSGADCHRGLTARLPVGNCPAGSWKWQPPTAPDDRHPPRRKDQPTAIASDPRFRLVGSAEIHENPLLPDTPSSHSALLRPHGAPPSGNWRHFSMTALVRWRALVAAISLTASESTSFRVPNRLATGLDSSAKTAYFIPSVSLSDNNRNESGG